MITLNKRIKLVFIGSYPRSGSTILDVLIRKTKDSNFISIGEFFYIFEKGFTNNELCADGLKFLDHPFWKEIFLNLDHEKAAKELDFFKNPLFFPIFFFIGSINKTILINFFPNLFQTFNTALERVHKNSGKRIIIDASKDPRQLFILTLLRKVDIEIIHLIRDSRATAFSWKKKKIYKENVYFKKKSILRSSLRWMNDHLWLILLAKINYKIPYKQLFYENLDKIHSFTFFEKKYYVDLKKEVSKFNIEIGGNVNKFINFKSISIDNEWKLKMKKIDSTLATFLTWPFIIYFNYKIKK